MLHLALLFFACTGTPDAPPAPPEPPPAESTADASDRGTLTIQCEPAAEVFVNGKFWVKTPVKDRALRAGRYRLTLSRHGKSAEHVVRIEGGRRTRLVEPCTP